MSLLNVIKLIFIELFFISDRRLFSSFPALFSNHRCSILGELVTASTVTSHAERLLTEDALQELS